MGDIAIRVCAGIAGAAIFTAINSYILTLSGTVWWLALAIVFVAAFSVAYLVQRRIRPDSKPGHLVGSRNESAGGMKIKVEDIAPDATKQVIGSENKSGGDMSVTVKGNR